MSFEINKCPFYFYGLLSFPTFPNNYWKLFFGAKFIKNGVGMASKRDG